MLSRTAGLALANVTVPGPRNLLHVTVTGGVFGGLAPGNVLASSATQTGNASGFGNVVVSVVLPRLALPGSVTVRLPGPNVRVTVELARAGAAPAASRPTTATAADAAAAR